MFSPPIVKQRLMLSSFIYNINPRLKEILKKCRGQGEGNDDMKCKCEKLLWRTVKSMEIMWKLNAAEVSHSSDRWKRWWGKETSVWVSYSVPEGGPTLLWPTSDKGTRKWNLFSEVVRLREQVCVQWWGTGWGGHWLPLVCFLKARTKQTPWLQEDALSKSVDFHVIKGLY